MSLTNDITNTFIDSQLINVSSRTLTFVAFGGNYSTQIYGGNATAGAGYTRGLRLFNALADQDGIPSSTPHAQFDKYTLNAGYVRPFSCGHQNFSASTQFSGQYAPDALYGSQQFSIGGQYTVRGFLDEALANDNGYYLRNDLTWLQTLNVGGRAINFRPLVALDVGSVGSVHPGTQHGTLVGSAIGADLSSGPVELTGLAGYPLIKPDTVENPGLSFLGRLSMTF
jgi:hemolysin activation/secretion protein